MPTKALHPDPEFTLGASSLATHDEAGRGRSAGRGNYRLKVAALVATVLVGGAAVIGLLWLRGVPVPEPETRPPPPTAAAPPAQPGPAIKHPVSQIPVPPTMENDHPAAPLPALDHSDVVAKDAIGTILDGDVYFRLLAPNGIIRRIVATIDNLPRKTMAVGIRPVMPVPGGFATTNAPDGTLIAGNDTGRYTPYVNAAETIDTERLVQFYVRLYPLFQQAYAELGYPDGYFNDRLIGVIDHLLSAPELKPPIRLSQPRIMLEFADPDLEARSAGQKILMRVGIDNESRLKLKLREIRKALTGKLVKP